VGGDTRIEVYTCPDRDVVGDWSYATFPRPFGKKKELSGKHNHNRSGRQ
jgi:hypothetical protein